MDVEKLALGLHAMMAQAVSEHVAGDPWERLPRCIQLPAALWSDFMAGVDQRDLKVIESSFLDKQAIIVRWRGVPVLRMMSIDTARLITAGNVVEEL